MRSAFIIAIVLATLQASASAQLLVPVALDRHVSARADGDDLVTFLSDSDRDDAVSSGLFMSTASANIEQPGEISVSAGASQTSEIFPDSIIARGSGFSDCDSSEFSWLIDGYGGSVVIVDFQVPVVVQCSILGSITAYDSGIATTTLIEVGSGSLLFSGFSIGDGEVAVGHCGVLVPGTTYRFDVTASGGTRLDGPGLDFGFTEFDLALELTQLPQNYCVAAPNSAGAGAIMGFAGSASLASNNFQLEANGARPGGSGLFFYGPGQIQAPFGDGFRCVGGMTFRLHPPVQSDATGLSSRLVDFTIGQPSSGAGAILPSSTWNFQLWYRDPTGPGGTGFNLSDGLQVSFCP